MDRTNESVDRALAGSQLTALRIAGLLAVFGGVVNAVGDFALRGGPSRVAAAEFTLESLASVSRESIWLGSFLGSLAMPLWLLGLWPVYVGLRRAGFWPAGMCILLFGYGICGGSAYHGAYVIYSSGFALQAELPNANGVATHVGHHDDFLAIMTAPWIAASVLFVVLVASGRSAFPRWMAIASPILVPISVSLASMLPAPFGGIVRPALGSLIWTLFFALALRLSWNGEPRSS